MKKKIAILLIFVLVLTFSLSACGDNFEVTNKQMYKSNAVLEIMKNHEDMAFEVKYYSDETTETSSVTGAYTHEDGNVVLEYTSSSNGVPNYGEMSIGKNGEAVSYAYDENGSVFIAIEPSSYDDKITESSMALSDLSEQEKQVSCEKKSDGTTVIKTEYYSTSPSHMECEYILDSKTLELKTSYVRVIDKNKNCTFKAVTEVKYDTGYKMNHNARNGVLSPLAPKPSTELTIVFDGKESVDYGLVPRDAEVLATGNKTYFLFKDSKQKNALQMGKSGYSIADTGIKQTLYAFSK